MWRYFLFILIVVKAVNLAQLTHYDVLGISRDASQQEIRSAYKKLAIKFHPDKNPDAEQQKKFLRVSEAYETLRDARRRRQYDGWGGHDAVDMRRGLYHEDPYVVSLTGLQDYEARLTEGLHFVNFYSPSCPPCRRLSPAWSRLAELYKDVVHFSAVNCRAHAHFCHNSMRIGSYPTLLFFPNGRQSSYMYYNGALEAAALERFVLRAVSQRAPAPPVARLRATTTQPLLYLLAAWRMEDGAPERLAYRLRGVVSVVIVEEDDLRAQLLAETPGSDTDVTAVLQRGEARTALGGGEGELPRAVAAGLPAPRALTPEDIKEIRSELRAGSRRALALRLRGDDSDPLEFLRLQADMPELDFGEIECASWPGLCAALQVPGGGRWAVLKVGGAYQAAPPPAPGPAPAPATFLSRAASLRNLHSLSETEFNRILEGESGTWVVGVARGSSLLEPLLAAAEAHRHRPRLQLGLLQCGSGATSAWCAGGARVLLQAGERRHELPAPGSAGDVLSFIELLLDDPVEYLTEDRVVELATWEQRPSWLVGCLPRVCDAACARAAHLWREVARMLKPLRDVRVGMLRCGGARGGLCDNVRVPSARLYRHGDRQVYGTSLLELESAWRAAQWALESLRAPVPALHAAEFADTVGKAGDLPWLVYFHSPRCHRCHELYPDFAIVSMVLSGRVRAGRVNCLEARGLCQRERVTSYPSVRLYRRGAASPLAAASAEQLLAALERLLPAQKHDEL